MSEKILSASRIKNLEGCSYRYWCDYHLNLPSSQNSGAARGTVCHLILECLLNPRHRHYIDVLLKAKTIEAVPSICRLVRKALGKEGSNQEFLDEENYKLCDEMILVGLNCDFLGGEGGEVNSPEKEFLIESESPKYKIRGFIDKPVEYPKEKKLKIVDYKTSKSKFPKGELDYNVQAMTYLLAAKQIWPKLTKDACVEFQFLKFPRKPLQEIKCSEDQLKGFEFYLEHIYGLINNFTEKEAHSNFASNQPWAGRDDGFKGPISCGKASYPGQLKDNGEPMWHCQYKFAYDYYVLLSEEGEIIKSVKEKSELEGLEGVVEKRRYEGCPAHPQPNSKQKDDFDFGEETKDDFDF